MFTKSAQFYDALYHFKDYRQAAEQLHALGQEQHPAAKTLLDVGCGTGKHVEYLQTYYRTDGLDINSELLEIARQRCPSSTFYRFDMTDFELGRTYDIITCLFSSIAYVRTVQALEQALACMSKHLTSGGLIIVEPWLTPEAYWKDRLVANFVDQPELKIAWMYTHQLEAAVSIFDINYLVGTPAGVEHFTERHEMGLFTHEQYLQSFRKANIDVQYDSKGFFGRGMYFGTRR